MRELRVVGVSGGALLIQSDDGEYRVEIDDVTLAELRRSRPVTEGKRVPPKQIQAHIRAGMSAEDVATLTGADLAFVERFEGPVLAERDYVVQSALNVTVHTAADQDAREATSFGAVIRERLAGGKATGERWASWKDPESGWVVKLVFTADRVEHDARWSFEPRTQALAPVNAEAIALSQQGSAPAGLIPRLRAVERDDRRDDRSERQRFDSDAFTIEDGDLAGPLDPQAGSRPSAPLNQTADLLDALRRRRGEREAALFEPEGEPEPGIRLVEVPLDHIDDELDLDGDEDESGQDESGQASIGQDRQSRADTGELAIASGQGSRSQRRSRPTMPSWDEIVFGARTDED